MVQSPHGAAMANSEVPGCSYPVAQPQEQVLWEIEQKQNVSSVMIGIVYSFHTWAFLPTQ